MKSSYFFYLLCVLLFLCTSIQVVSAEGGIVYTATLALPTTVPTYGPPNPGFTATPTTGNAPLNVQFTDATTGSVTTRSWDFGDGSTSSAYNPIHLYSSVGTYSVTLTATNGAGSKSIAKSGYITVSAPTAGGYVYTTQWGIDGSLSDIAVDGTGNVYVVDMGNSQIHKFTSTGTFITKWGSSGVENGQFNHLESIATDSVGNIYVVDKGGSQIQMFGHRIQKFTSAGKFITNWYVEDPRHGDYGNTVGVSNNVAGVSVDSAGNVYVLDVEKHSYGDYYTKSWIYKFDSSGTVITRWDVESQGDGPYSNPSGITVDSAGKVYVTDSESKYYGEFSTKSWVQMFDSSGTFITRWGSFGSEDGQFNSPTGVAIDSTGNIYVADTGNDRVQKFDAAGTFITAWGSDGSGNGQFNGPSGIAVDSVGNVYVTDWYNNNNRIQKFAPVTQPTLLSTLLSSNFTMTPTTGTAPLTVQFTDTTIGNMTSWSWDFGDGFTSHARNPSHLYSVAGTYLAELTATNAAQSPSLTLTKYIVVSAPLVTPAAGGYVYISQWGDRGAGYGQFSYPMGVAVDSIGNVYVADVGYNWIQKFSSTGAFITKWGGGGPGWDGSGSADGQFNYPCGIAVDRTGNVYVADRGNNRVQKFDSFGRFITKWGSAGSGDGQFWGPSGVAVDSADNVYVTDQTNCRVQKFDSTGAFITKWGSSGFGDGQFDGPSGIAVDSVGNVYVTDLYNNNNRIQKFTSTGKFITKWGSSNSANGQFNHPDNVAVDSVGNVYVTDWGNNRIQKFDSSGKFITTWGNCGSGNGQFSSHIGGVAVDSAGNVYVADSIIGRIQKFAPVTQPSPTPTITVITPIPSVPTSVKAPHDLNHDGLYEDLNGNGGLDFNDVVTYFNQMDWIADNEPVNAFDFNKNGQIDFNDIVILFNEM